MSEQKNCLDTKKKINQTVRFSVQYHGHCTSIVTPNKGYAACFCFVTFVLRCWDKSA